jgi:hypothetical protein
VPLIKVDPPLHGRIGYVGDRAPEESDGGNARNVGESWLARGDQRVGAEGVDCSFWLLTRVPYEGGVSR